MEGGLQHLEGARLYHSGQLPGQGCDDRTADRRYRVQVKLGASADALKPYHAPGTVEIRLAETTSVDAGFDFAEGAF